MCFLFLTAVAIDVQLREHLRTCLRGCFLINVLYRTTDMSFLIEFSVEFASVVKVFTLVVIRVVDRDKMKYLTIIICSLFVDHGSFLVLFLEYIPMCILIPFDVHRFCFHTVGTRQFTLFYF